MPSVLVVEPVFAPRIWGGNMLRQWYGDKVPSGVIGECWAVSGLEGNAGLISAGAPAGTTLDVAWAEGLVTGEPRSDDFPLLCKLLDPADWLSVQVHPNDQQARALEGMPRGKSESWYVLACEPGAELIMGHRRNSADELRDDLAAGSLLSQLIRNPVQPGSFFMVPAGTVHAVGPGMLVYEAQQSSDITYRLYDFDRLGVDGEPRELHVDKGFSVVTAPYEAEATKTEQEPVAIAGGTRQDLVANADFAVSHWSITSTAALSSDEFRVITVIAGSGELLAEDQDPVPLDRGVSLIVPRDAGTVEVAGELVLMVTDPGGSL